MIEKIFGICFGIQAPNWVESGQLFGLDNETNTFLKVE